MTGGHHF